MRIPGRPLLIAAALVAACQPRGGCSGEFCGTLVFVTGGEPDILLPASTDNQTSRDVQEQIFLKLAGIGLSMNTIGDEDFEPLLARRWEWDDPRTLVFHIDPRARWHDGTPVTAGDVAFTFDAYVDSNVASPYRAPLRRVASVLARDSLTAVFRFRERYPEMFYDAVYHMRILPAHLLRGVPRNQWRTAAFGRQPVGNGPYRLVSWRAGESLELEADSSFYLGRPRIRRLIWRITPDLGVAVTQLVADQGDGLNILGTPDNIARARAAQQLTLYPYAGTLYGALTFNMTAPGDTTRPHPIFADREVRRALTLALDRDRMLTSVFGEYAKVPPGPMSQLWWIWDPNLGRLPYDTLRAGRTLAARGWRDSDADGIRDKEGQPLAFRILVPSTSPPRRQYARLIQEQLRAAGARIEIDEVDFSVWADRARSGRFDAIMVSWNTDPTPTSGITQVWTRAGFGGSNYGRYDSPAFDALIDRAVLATTRDQARAAWRRAMALISEDAPAVFLFALDNVGAFHSRVADVTLRPDSWAALVRKWRIPPDRLIDRDRVER